MARSPKQLLLKMFLIYLAIGWGICIVGVFVPGNSAFNMLGYIGGIEPSLLQSDNMYDYWLRMASSVFSFVGLICLLPVINYDKFKSLVPVIGTFMLFEGFVLLIHGLILQIPIYPLWGDVGFCLVGGGGVLCCMKMKRSRKDG